MLRNFFLSFICISSIYFCQDTSGNNTGKAYLWQSISPEAKDTIPKGKGKPPVKGKQTSAVKGKETSATKGKITSPAKGKETTCAKAKNNPSTKETPNSVSAGEKKAGEAAGAYVDSLRLIQEYKSTQTKNEKQIRDLQKENSQLKAGIDNKNNLSPSTNIAVWVIPVLSILLLLTVFLFYKNRRMSMENDRRKQMIDNYSKNVENLKNFMQKKGLLSPLANYEIISLTKRIEELIDKYVNGDNRNQIISTEMEGLRNKLSATMQENNLLQRNSGQAVAAAPVREFIPYVTTTPKSYIKSEIILSAGPRKDAGNNDTELGEDVAGSISFPNQTFFWILDGTSDSAAIKSLSIDENSSRHEEVHIFSSRLLAQSIGNYIQKNITYCFESKIELNELLRLAVAHVSAEWEKRLNNELPKKKESILQLIRKGFKPLCSTTVIIGRLLDDGHLYALRTGDSKIFPFKNSNGHFTLDKNFKFTADPTDEYDRVAFRLDVDESSQAFIIKQNVPKWLIQVTDNVHYVFAFTDGIGRVTEAQLASDNPGIVEMIRQNIARIPQKTHDDKTLVILERVMNE